MKVIQEDYGRDADGNRGEIITYIELEDTQEERMEIATILYEKALKREYVGTINLENIEMDVDIDEYIDEFIEIANQDESLNKEDKLYLEDEFDININNKFLNKKKSKKKAKKHNLL